MSSPHEPQETEYARGFQDGARSQEPSEWVRQQKAEAWDEGQLASVQLHQLLLNQSFLATKANPYRDYPEGDGRPAEGASSISIIRSELRRYYDKYVAKDDQ